MLKIKDYFDILRIESVIDNFSYHEYQFISTPNFEKLKSIKKEDYDEFNLFLSEKQCEWTLEVEEIDYTISQSQYNEVESFENEDFDELTVKLSIFKNGSIVFIFDNKEFSKFLDSITLEEVLKLFSAKTKGVVFLDKSNEKSAANSFIGFNNTDLSVEEPEHIEINSQCNYTNLSQFKFSPNNFNLKIPSEGSILLKVLDKIHLVYNLIYIFDFSEIRANEIALKISGLKTIKYKLDFKKINTSSNETYTKIVDWIYSEPSKIEDKIGITRNILSIYLHEDSINIDENAFNSILSANNAYIK